MQTGKDRHMILKLLDIHKTFGEKEVLQGISLTAQSGRAFGLLGRNGAGKTTSIRILMDGQRVRTNRRTAH